MTPKKYKNLKDIPGYRGNTVPAGSTFTKTDYDRYVQDDDVEFTVDADVIESGTAWFEPVQERPYPFTPSVGERYHAVSAEDSDEDCRIDSYRWDNTGSEPYWLTIANLWRTTADAQRRVDLEPLFNRALQSVINRGSPESVPAQGGFGITRNGSDSFSTRPAGWVVEDHPYENFQRPSGTLFSTREDAEAVVAFLKALFA